MKTKPTKPADTGSIPEAWKKRLQVVRALERTESPIAKFNRIVGEIVATEKAVKAGKHLRLVVDNDRGRA